MTEQYWRELTKPEQATSLEQIDGVMTFSETELTAKLEAIISRQEKTAVAELKALHQSNQSPLRLVIRYKNEYANAIAASLTDAIHKGYEIAAKDLKISKKQLPELSSHVRQIAELYSDKAAMDLRFMILMAYLQLTIKSAGENNESKKATTS